MKKELLETRSIDELVNGLGTMLRNMPHLAKSKTVVHYVGMNYTLHLEELEKRRYFVLADYYRKEWEKVTK